MTKKIEFVALILTISVLIFTPKMHAETNRTNMDELKENAPKVFLDCWRCDRDYIRKEITYVNFVRDRTDADIHILVTDENTGSGGNKYTLTFMGRNQFEDMETTLTYSSNETETMDETREGMLEVMKKGLFPFLMKTPIADLLSVQCKMELEPTSVKDNWNFWVFNIRVSGELQELGQGIQA